jgi:hypothetical protein
MVMASDQTDVTASPVAAIGCTLFAADLPVVPHGRPRSRRREDTRRSRYAPLGRVRTGLVLPGMCARTIDACPGRPLVQTHALLDVAERRHRGHRARPDMRH